MPKLYHKKTGAEIDPKQGSAAYKRAVKSGRWLTESQARKSDGDSDGK